MSVCRGRAEGRCLVVSSLSPWATRQKRRSRAGVTRAGSPTYAHGRLVAYASTESGRPEVYVRRFPDRDLWFKSP